MRSMRESASVDCMRLDDRAGMRSQRPPRLKAPQGSSRLPAIQGREELHRIPTQDCLAGPSATLALDRFGRRRATLASLNSPAIA
jgi:hypothetical protein